MITGEPAQHQQWRLSPEHGGRVIEDLRVAQRSEEAAVAMLKEEFTSLIPSKPFCRVFIHAVKTPHPTMLTRKT